MNIIISLADSEEMIKAIAQTRNYQIMGDILSFDNLETDNFLRGALGGQYIGSDASGFVALASR